MISFTIIPIILGIVNSGCSCFHAPEIIYQCPKVFYTVAAVDSLKFVLDSLNPSEDTILIRKKTVPISIYMEAHGDCNYVLELKANRKTFHPFVLSMNSGNGKIDFSGRITWYIKLKGKIERLTVALYKIEKSKSCKTETKTLIKSITRNYNLICGRR